MINRTVLVGRLVADPELRYTPAGIPVCKFRLAVNRIFKNEGEQQADFINCIAWRKQAENLANYMRKGSLVGIDGRIQTGSYEDQDGKKVFYTEVVAESIQFLESKNAQNGSNSATNYQGNTNYQSSNQNGYSGQNQPNNDPFSSYNEPVNVNSDDLPF